MKSNTRDEDVLRAFGQHLSNIRQAKKISQEKLGNMIDVPQSTIGRIERGLSNPNLCLLVAIARSLDVDLRELVGFEL